MTVQSPPYALQNASHTAALFRQAATSQLNAFGVASTPEFKITQQATPSMSVVAAAGRAWVPGSIVSNIAGQSFGTQGAYFVLNDAALGVTVATSDPVNPRIDLVYLSVSDAYYSGAANTAQVGIVTGTPAVSPAIPTGPNNAIPLATIAVAANATSIVNANITDQRTYLGAVSPTNNGMDLSQTANQALANTTWTVLTMASTDYTAGAGLSASSGGITVTVTGRYLVTASVTYAANTTGERFIGLSPSSLSPTMFRNAVPAAGAGFDRPLSISQEMTLSAGTTIAVWGYQSSGGALNVNNRHISVRQLA